MYLLFLFLAIKYLFNICCKVPIIRRIFDIYHILYSKRENNYLQLINCQIHILTTFLIKKIGIYNKLLLYILYLIKHISLSNFYLTIKLQIKVLANIIGRKVGISNDLTFTSYIFAFYDLTGLKYKLHLIF